MMAEEGIRATAAALQLLARDPQHIGGRIDMLYAA